MHRLLAYAVFTFTIIWWLKASKQQVSAFFNQAKNLPLILVIAQVLLGIISVLTSPQIVVGSFGVFEWMALLHQLVGMLLLLSLVVNVYLIKSK